MLTLFASIICTFLSFKQPSISVIALFIGTILYCLCFWMQYNSSNPKPKMINVILMDYSIHIIIMNLVYILIGGCTFSWLLILGFSSFYQCVIYLSSNLPAGSLQQLIQKIYLKINPYVQQILVIIELLNFAPISSPEKRSSYLISVFIYIFWFFFYRYATNQIHQMIWTQYRNQIYGFAAKTPNIISKLIYSLVNLFCSIGNLAISLYHVR